jgi:protein-S-isoprenylcysteine O-methyltransferase Ste14
MLNWIGCSILSASLIIALGTGATAVIYILAARGEEQSLMRSKLGHTYAEYKTSTGLLLPRLWKR